MMSSLEKARQVLAEKNAAHFAATQAFKELKSSGTCIGTQEERALIAAGLPLPENSYTFTTWLASYNAVHNAAKAAVAAREVIQTLEQAEYLEQLRALMA